MGTGFTIGYVNSAVFLFLLTGWAILRFDTKGYEQSGMNREKKAAQVTGYLNIALGISTFIGNLIMKSMFNF